MGNEYKYDVAISFAEEDRNAALALSLALEMYGFKSIYYYPEKRAATWGSDLKNSLSKTYETEARYSIILLSDHYFDKKKVYPKIEFNAIEKRSNRQPGIVYMLPVKLDNSRRYEAYHLLAGKAYLEWNYNPKEIAQVVKELLGKKHDNIFQKKESLLYINGNNNQQIINTNVYGSIAGRDVIRSKVVINIFK